MFRIIIDLHMKQDCNDLSEEDLSKLGINLLNCQSRLEGRKVFPCSSSMERYKIMFSFKVVCN